MTGPEAWRAEALEERHVAKPTLAELEKMSPEDERFDAKMTVLIETVGHHVKEEEEILFPNVHKRMAKDTLLALGAAMEKAKAVAPTRPRPMAPDTPPGNIVSDVLARLLDSGRACRERRVPSLENRPRVDLAPRESETAPEHLTAARPAFRRHLHGTSHRAPGGGASFSVSCANSISMNSLAPSCPVMRTQSVLPGVGLKEIS